MALRWVLVTLFHLIPALPFAQGYVYGGFAAVLFVALPYIKTKKLTAYIQALEDASPGARSPVVAAELESLIATRDRWRWLTFARGAARSP